VQLLVEKGADVKAVMMDKGGTAPHWATEKGYEAVVRLLVEEGSTTTRRRRIMDRRRRTGRPKSGIRRWCRYWWRRGPT
jgi:ankyrin repeat protein